MPPPNVTPETAIALTLPASLDQNVHDGGTTYSVFYKYTNAGAAGDEVISFQFSGNFGGGGYRPFVDVYRDIDLDIFLARSSVNNALQLPIRAGDTYWFLVFTNAGDPSPAILDVRMIRAPTTWQRRGRVFIRSASMD